MNCLLSNQTAKFFSYFSHYATIVVIKDIIRIICRNCSAQNPKIFFLKPECVLFCFPETFPCRVKTLFIDYTPCPSKKAFYLISEIHFVFDIT